MIQYSKVTLRPVTAALDASIALTSSILGPILFFVLFNAVRLAIRCLRFTYGYNKGTTIVADMAAGRPQKLT